MMRLTARKRRLRPKSPRPAREFLTPRWIARNAVVLSGAAWGVACGTMCAAFALGAVASGGALGEAAVPRDLDAAAVVHEPLQPDLAREMAAYTHLLRSAYEQHIGNLPGARKALQQALESMETAALYARSGDLALTMQNPRRAEVDSEKAIALDPTHADAYLTLGKREYNERLAAAQQRFLELRLQLGGQTTNGKIGPGLLVVMEGSDAGGKGGAIKRLVQLLDPRHYSVYSYAAPSSRELRHHFLWRFWSKVPGRGGMCVFDRSWYGRVLVERVEGFATPTEWNRAYDKIVDFERGLVVEGVIVIKFWMQVSPKEQLNRFESRADDPLRQWKLTDEDWRNRKQWDAYYAAVEEMLARTSTPYAPWTVVESNCKWFARIKVLDSVINAIEAAL